VGPGFLSIEDQRLECNRLNRSKPTSYCVVVLTSFFSAGEQMKAKHLLLMALLLLSSCSLIWTPTATVKKFMAAAQKGDVDTMTQLFSRKAFQKLGADTIRTNNQLFADTARRVTSASGTYRMENIVETSTADGKQVSFFYTPDKGFGSTKLVFVLSKEGSAWKIDKMGPESDEIKTDVPTTTVPMLTQEPGATPPTLSSEKAEAETKTSTDSKTISGGVLNDKAISLPKPPYPPIARAAKASGTVVVQVTIDENGNVISARAVSGHPLLQAAAIAAARSAKFSPTRLSGQPVKVTGLITYNFVAE
jgi:TonB family protein